MRVPEPYLILGKTSRKSANAWPDRRSRSYEDSKSPVALPLAVARAARHHSDPEAELIRKFAALTKAFMDDLCETRQTTD
ncbi:hypothetical protein [Methanopyrus sp.]